MGTTHEETRYTCKKCKDNSTQETNLKKHIETTHDETSLTKTVQENSLRIDKNLT